MAKRHYTRELLTQIKQGRVPVATVRGARVMYAPRRKTDPQPWSDGFFRYGGREVHCVTPCRLKVPSAPGTAVFCGLVLDHDPDMACRVLPAVLYTIG